MKKSATVRFTKNEIIRAANKKIRDVRQECDQKLRKSRAEGYDLARAELEVKKAPASVENPSARIRQLERRLKEVSDKLADAQVGPHASEANIEKLSKTVALLSARNKVLVTQNKILRATLRRYSKRRSDDLSGLFESANGSSLPSPK